MGAMRLTIEERRYEQVRGDLLAAETAAHDAKGLPGAYRTAVKRYRKALYVYHLAAHHPALTKNWQAYAGQRGWKNKLYVTIKYHKSEAEAARRSHETLSRARESMNETFERFMRRKELLGTARTEAARLKPQAEAFQQLAEGSRMKLDKKKAETDKKRSARTPAATWVEIEPGKAIMGKPLAAWKRTFTARKPTPVTMRRENGSFVFQHPTGELRLNWKEVKTLNVKERDGLQAAA